MPSNKPQINTRITDNELFALHELMEVLELNKAEAIRHCIKAECERNGIESEDTMPKRGKYHRKYYGLIETNHGGGLTSANVCGGQFEDNLSHAMLSYNCNYFMTEYYPSKGEAQEALDDLVDELYPE